MVTHYPIGVNTPIEKRAYSAAAKAKYRAANYPPEDRPFVGIDGEGFNIVTPEGVHHVYALLRAGERPLHSKSGEPLTTLQCLQFISELPPNYIYVGYFFDYDVTMILRGMPAERIYRLLHPELRTRFIKTTGMWVTRPLDYEGFQIDYRAGKEFKVRRFLKTGPNNKPMYSHYVTINDVGSFFQCAFIKSLTEWDIGTPEQREMIGDGKAKRGSHISLDADTIKYNALEIDLLEKLMEKFRGVCHDLGIKPRRWQGPGQLAEALLKKHGVIKTEDLKLPPELLSAATAAYYGGRFETGAVGTVQGPIYAYDINSAYPDAIRKLPCLIHGGWEIYPWKKDGRVTARPYGAEKPDSNQRERVLYLAHGQFEVKIEHNPRYYGFPFRNEHGGILYPSSGRGWYWSIEIEAAIHQTFRIDRDMWVYTSQCDCTPFDWVPPLYIERQRLKETDMGGVLKLILNSLYGKMCQSVGHPTYANPIYASLITAFTRVKLSSLMHYIPPPASKAPSKAPRQTKGNYECLCCNVLMVATDAVFTTTPLHLKAPIELHGYSNVISGIRPIMVTPNNELGGWDFEEHSSIHIIMPGVYFKGDGNTPKTRGVPRQKIIEYKEDFLRIGDAVRRGITSPAKGYPHIQLPREVENFERPPENRGDILWGSVTVPLTQFQGLRVSSHRNRLDLAGEWLPCGDNGQGKTLKYRWSNKRASYRIDEIINGAPALLTGPQRYWNGGDETLPYSKNIGQMIDDTFEGGRLEDKDQPDWADILIDEE